MKLRLVAARQGVTWVKLGVGTFFKQPLALAGLFFMFMALMSVAGMVPLIGLPLAMILLPACTLGLMAASLEATQGRFPMPWILLTAFRSGAPTLRAMLILGAWYALGFVAVMGLSYLVDGGGFAGMYLAGQAPTAEMLASGRFQAAMWVFIGFHLPLSLLFWHAPALVHWHGVSPAKSLFFSFMACYKNFGALTVFALVWVLLFFAMALVVALLATLLGNPEFAGVAMFPAAMLMVSMFFTSLYFTFRDSFVADEDSPQSAAHIVDISA
jgi:hypothetical protein